MDVLSDRKMRGRTPLGLRQVEPTLHPLKIDDMVTDVQIMAEGRCQPSIQDWEPPISMMDINALVPGKHPVQPFHRTGLLLMPGLKGCLKTLDQARQLSN